MIEGLDKNLKDMGADLKESFKDMLMEVDIPTTVNSSTRESQEVLEKAPCEICDELGHIGKDCSQRSKDVWCRRCGLDYHVTKNCTQNVANCNWCGMKNDHSVRLHHLKPQESHKKVELVGKYGEKFSHFFMGTQGPSGLHRGGTKGGFRGRGGNSRGAQFYSSDFFIAFMFYSMFNIFLHVCFVHPSPVTQWNCF